MFRLRTLTREVMQMKTYLSIPFAGRDMVACIHYNDQVDPMEILVRDQGFEVTAFRQLPDKIWLFNPESLPIRPQPYDSADAKLFVLDLQVLRHILVNEPFAFPLDSCRDLHPDCDGKCCSQPPSLGALEAEYFSANHGLECLDLSGLIVHLSKVNDYCFFFNPEDKQCKLHGSGKPRICTWQYCHFNDKISNMWEMALYIHSVLSPQSTAQVLDQYRQSP